MLRFCSIPNARPRSTLRALSTWIVRPSLGPTWNGGAAVAATVALAKSPERFPGMPRNKAAALACDCDGRSVRGISSGSPGLFRSGVAIFVGGALRLRLRDLSNSSNALAGTCSRRGPGAVAGLARAWGPWAKLSREEMRLSRASGDDGEGFGLLDVEDVFGDVDDGSDGWLSGARIGWSARNGELEFIVRIDAIKGLM